MIHDIVDSMSLFGLGKTCSYCGVRLPTESASRSRKKIETEAAALLFAGLRVLECRLARNAPASS